MADRGIAGQPSAPARLAPYYDQMPDIARFYSRPPDVSSVGKGWVEGYGDETPRPMSPLPSGILDQLSRMGQQGGARLTTKARKAIPTSSFALPGRRYPINDPSHARNALSRGAQNASPAELAKIRAAVHRKYPSIGQQAGARALPEARLSWEGQYGARMHSDEAQDRKLIMSLLHKHGLLEDQQAGARGPLFGTPDMPSSGNMFAPLAQGLAMWKQGNKPDVGASSVAMPEQAGARYAPEHDATEPGWFRMPAHHTTIAITLKPRARQAGARMASFSTPKISIHPRQHALAMASATHLANMGHITPEHKEAIHNDALGQLKAHKAKKPAAMKFAAPSFGSLAPPPMPGAMGAMANVPSGMGPPPMPQLPEQAGARYKYPKYGAGHYMSTPTPVSSGSSMGAGQSGGSAGARWKY